MSTMKGRPWKGAWVSVKTPFSTLGRRAVLGMRVCAPNSLRPMKSTVSAATLRRHAGQVLRLAAIDVVGVELDARLRVRLEDLAERVRADQEDAEPGVAGALEVARAAGRQHEVEEAGEADRRGEREVLRAQPDVADAEGALARGEGVDELRAGVEARRLLSDRVDEARVEGRLVHRAARERAEEGDVDVDVEVVEQAVGEAEVEELRLEIEIEVELGEDLVGGEVRVLVGEIAAAEAEEDPLAARIAG
jgi:hypothetical protein